jgi:membrane fusion protein
VQIERQITVQAQRAELSASHLSADVERLCRAGVVQKDECKRRREAYLIQMRDLAALTQGFEAKQNELTAAHFSLEQLPVTMAEKIQQLQDEQLGSEQRIAEMEGGRAYIVRAPVAGRVSSLQATVGQAADSRQSVLAILPGDGVLQAELFVPTRAAGFIRPGQEVRVLYDAFPYQRFGTHTGHVAEVSETVVLPSEHQRSTALQEAAYRVIVALDRQDVLAGGVSVTLRPDMQLRADIVLERRSLIVWLLDPLSRVRA